MHRVDCFHATWPLVRQWNFLFPVANELGNNKEQTFQSAEEDYYPSFHFLIGMPLEGQCGLRH